MLLFVAFATAHAVAREQLKQVLGAASSENITALSLPNDRDNNMDNRSNLRGFEAPMQNVDDYEPQKSRKVRVRVRAICHSSLIRSPHYFISSLAATNTSPILPEVWAKRERSQTETKHDRVPTLSKTSNYQATYRRKKCKI